jgi:hypothetical protein
LVEPILGLGAIEIEKIKLRHFGNCRRNLVSSLPRGMPKVVIYR